MWQLIDDDYEGLASEEERVMPIAVVAQRKADCHFAESRRDHDGRQYSDGICPNGFTRRNDSAKSYRLRRRRALWDANRLRFRASAARQTKEEIAKIPAFAPLWKDFLTRLKQTDADLFEN